MQEEHVSLSLPPTPPSDPLWTVPTQAGMALTYLRGEGGGARGQDLNAKWLLPLSGVGEKFISSRQEWMHARVLFSDLLSPAYICFRELQRIRGPGVQCQPPQDESVSFC